MDVKIRNLNKDELGDAAKIFIESFNSVGEKWTYEIALARLNSMFDTEFYFGAFLNDRMVAIMTTKIDFVLDHKELYIDIFAVTPAFQNKHIGKVFLDQIELFAKEKGLTTIWLQASTKLPSYKFYLKNGFNSSHWVAVNKNL